MSLRHPVCKGPLKVPPALQNLLYIYTRRYIIDINMYIYMYICKYVYIYVYMYISLCSRVEIDLCKRALCLWSSLWGFFLQKSPLFVRLFVDFFGKEPCGVLCRAFFGLYFCKALHDFFWKEHNDVGLLKRYHSLECLYIYMYIYICIYVHMYIGVYLYLCIHIYICIYVYTFICI